MTEVIGLGAGGHAKVVIEMIRLNGLYSVVGLLDQDASQTGSEVDGVKVLGDDSLLPELFARGVTNAFIGIGTVGFTTKRHDLFVMLRAVGFTLVSAIHPSAVVSKHATLGDGVTIMAGAIVNPGSRLGNNVIINTGAVVEHDCEVGDDTHIATRACLAGGVKVKSGVHLGAGAIVRQNIEIGANAVIAAGAVVVKDVPDNVVVMGVPAKFYKRVE